MPSAVLCIADALAAWIMVQIITGRAMYRHTSASRRDEPRGFWALVGLEALVVVPIVCFQFRLDVVAIALFLVLVAILLGFCLYVLWLLLDLAVHPRRTWEAFRSRYTEDPKEF